MFLSGVLPWFNAADEDAADVVLEPSLFPHMGMVLNY